MASAKKRKTDHEGQPMTSAFSALAGLRRSVRQPSGDDLSKTSNLEVRPAETAEETTPARTSRPKRGKGLPDSTPPISSAAVQDKAELVNLSEASESQRPSLGRLNQHSSFTPSAKNFRKLKDGSVNIQLLEGERLVVLGSYGLRIHDGDITVAGAALNSGNEIQWIHAPHCHALPVVRAIRETSLTLCPHPGAVALRQLERLSPVFAKLWNTTPSLELPESSKLTSSTFQVIFTSDDGPKQPSLCDLVSPPEWNKKLAELAKARQNAPPIVLVCGPKSSGKSTFGKLLANRLITQQNGAKKLLWPGVAVLDIDPGQPEYAPPGLVSLVHLTQPNLSPSFCLSPAEIVRSHGIAAPSPASDPEHYIECVLDLFAAYQKDVQHKWPLVVNTAGWIQGTGLENLVRLIGQIRPTEVIYLSTEGPEDTVDDLKQACHDIPFVELPSQPNEYTTRTAAHFRMMQTMSYFHSRKSKKEAAYAQWDPLPLSHVPPYRIRYAEPNQGILGILHYDFQPPPNLLLDTINGTVLALVEMEDTAALRGLFTDAGDAMQVDADNMAKNDGEELNNSPEAKSMVHRDAGELPLIRNPNGQTLDPRHSRAIGLVLLRGVDTERKELHILAPFLEEELGRLNGCRDRLVLVAGKFDTPSWAYTEDLYRQAYASNGKDEGTTDAETDGPDEEEANREIARGHIEDTQYPWVEKLERGQKKTTGSKVWRVRRDLGRGGA